MKVGDERMYKSYCNEMWLKIIKEQHWQTHLKIELQNKDI